MAESSSVRLLQHHLRQAGALIASRQFDAASTHVDAALAIDPASLAALTLRDRLVTMRVQSQQATPPSAEPKSDATARFIPSGVNADSWLDFEQRIQARRFRALIEAADRAIATGDGAAARSAIEEARELRPDAGEVARLSARATMLQISAAAPAREGFLRSRTFRAVSLLLLGVALLMGLDWVRSGPASPAASVKIPADSASAPGANPAITDDRSQNDAALNAAATSGLTPEPLDVTFRSLATPTSVPPVVAPTSVPEGQGTSAETATSSPLPSAGLARNAVSTPPVIRGEVSDDYVAPRREASRDVAPSVNRPVTPAAPLTSVVRQPVSVESFGPSPVPNGPTPAPPASASPASAPPAPAAALTPSPTLAPVVAPPTVSDNSRVNAVLNQYASAYAQLNASAVRSIWPSVDERALSKAFSNLSSQSMSFDNCDIVVNGVTARASCRGRASYVVKVGNQERHNETRTVRFDLKRDGDAWKILKAETSK